MTEQEKIDRLADVLDQDSGALKADTPLDTIGWDSMGMLSVIALAVPSTLNNILLELL